MIFFILISILLCVAAPASAASNHRLATFNIRYTGAAADTEGKDWANRGPYCSKLITDYNLDVVGFQELTGTGRAYRNSKTGRTQLDDMKAWLPEYTFVEWDRDGSKRYEYVAIAYKTNKYTVLDKGSFFISATPDKHSYGWDTSVENHSRVLGWLRLRDNASGEEFIYAATHTNDGWSLDGPAGSSLVADRMKEIAGNTPVMVVADYNTSRKSRDRKGLKAYHAAFHDAALDVPADKNYSLPVTNRPVTWTYNAFHPASETTYSGSEIDFMFYRGMDIKERHIITEGLNYNGVDYPASDHYPVYVDATLAPTAPKTIYVSATASANGNGSMQSPYSTLSAAIAASDIDDTILVTAGEFAESIEPAYTVKIVGGYDDSFKNVIGRTIINGKNLQTSPINAAASIDLTLENFEIKDYVSKDVNYDGAIHFNGSDLELKNVVIEGCEATDFGGALSIYNRTDPIYCDAYNITLNNCVFRNNKAPNGGAVALGLYGELLIDNCTFENNEATTTGGAVYLTFGTPESGRIWFSNAKAIIRNSAFANNSSVRNGALHINDEMPNVNISVYNTTFGGNTVNARGGLVSVIKTYGGAAINAFLADCPANAALSTVKNSKLNIGHVTIIGNHATCSSPANFIGSAVNTNNGEVKLMNNIIAANTTNGTSAYPDVTVTPAERLKSEIANIFSSAASVPFSTSDRTHVAASHEEGTANIAAMFDGSMVDGQYIPEFTHNTDYATPYIFQKSTLFGNTEVATLSLLQRNVEKEFNVDLDGDGVTSTQTKKDQLGKDRNSKSMPGAVEFDMELSEVESIADNIAPVTASYEDGTLLINSDSAIGNIAVYDMAGLCVYSASISENTASIDCSSWGNGIFVLNIGKSNIKFII